MRVAFSSMAWNTGCNSPGDELMTPSTSAVAVCWSSDWRSSVSSRVFSMAMTAWAAKFGYELDLLIGERPHLLAENDDGADQLAFLEHRYRQDGPIAAEVGASDNHRIALDVGFFNRNVGDMDNLFGPCHAAYGYLGTRPHWSAPHIFGKGRRGIVQGAGAEGISLAKH